MSWDAYIDRLKYEKVITEAAICAFDGSIYAASEGLKCITPEQVKILAGSSSQMNMCGPTVGNIKCMFLRDERDYEQSFCMQLKANESSGKQTVCVGKAKTVLVIAVAPANANITNTVYSTTKYLRDNNI